MNENIEIRKLPPTSQRKLDEILEYADSWKKLMAIIPKTLERDSYVCDLSSVNPNKYHSDHFRMIEDASNKFKRPCSAILLDEWGTSGRVRPTLRHILYLLKKAELFQAADYVAMDLLKERRPERPKNTPAATISINFDDFDELTENHSIENNIDKNNIGLKNIGDKNISQEYSVSDMIVFSSNHCNLEIENETNLDSYNIPAFSKINSDKGLPLLKECEFVPTHNLSTESVDMESARSNSLPEIQMMLQSDENVMPPVDFLLASNRNESLENINRAESDNLINFDLLTPPQNRSINCASPLPNLSLNTILPHFPFAKLQTSTNNFDDEPYESSVEEVGCINGRFLGKGAFGAVYLATGLLMKPIAVKKLFLNDTKVTIDDMITQQFINEVEFLSRCNHENLLNICGYSCDGPTYCLLYDYMSGGALNSRLKKQKEKLHWRDRMNIALGTSKAVVYLHTALSKQLIHRDIKSANIFLDQNNIPKLGDFGNVKSTPRQNTIVTTTIIGTSVYMAPETFRSGEVTVKTDTFSFGVVILELLSALPPYDQSRDCSDLISYVEEMCENHGIIAILDTSTGDWKCYDLCLADELYKIASRCLEDKRRRPTMVQIKDELIKLNEIIVSRCN